MSMIAIFSALMMAPGPAAEAPADVAYRELLAGDNRAAVVRIQPASARGSRSPSRCWTSRSHTTWPTSKPSSTLSRCRRTVDMTSGLNRSTISSHAS